MPTTVTSSNETQTPKSADGYAVGQSSSDLVGFWGKAPVDQPAALTAQLTTITHTDPAGNADYSFGTVTTTSGAGFSSVHEANTLLMVVANLQTRCAEIEARLEECGIVAAN